MNWDCWRFRYFWKGLFRYHVFGRHAPGFLCLACVQEPDVRITAAMARGSHVPPYIPPSLVTDPRWPDEPCGAPGARLCRFDQDQHAAFDQHMTFLRAIARRQAQRLEPGGTPDG